MLLQKSEFETCFESLMAAVKDKGDIVLMVRQRTNTVVDHMEKLSFWSNSKVHRLIKGGFISPR